MSSADAACRKLLTENADLRTRLEEAQDTLRAIRGRRSGRPGGLWPGRRADLHPEGGRPCLPHPGGDHQRRHRHPVPGRRHPLCPTNQWPPCWAGGSNRLSGSPLLVFFPAWHQVGVFRTLLAQAKKDAGRGEIFLKKDDGFLIPTLLSCRSLRLEQVPEAVCLVALDLTGLKESETALKESEQKLVS